MRPLVTILIPTRERADVLVHSLQTAVCQDYPNLEIIVCDNESSDNTRVVVDSFNDKRIRYVNPGKRLSMTSNWEFGLSHVRDGWITILGDDDGILPCAIQRVIEIARATGVKAVRSNSCTYHWPSMNRSGYGTLSVEQTSGYELRYTKIWLEKVLAAKASYNSLPMLYNGGFIHTTVIAAARKITGDFFRSMIPDVYSAIAIASVIEEYVYCHEPLAVNGVSVNSCGSSFFNGDQGNKGGASPAMRFFSEKNIPFHPDLPLVENYKPPLSIQALVYESYLQSLPLVKNRFAVATHACQAALILKTAGRHKKEVANWTKTFCMLHQLPYPKKEKSLVAPWLAFASRLSTSFRTRKKNGHRYSPIDNVYIASQLAYKMKTARITWIQNLFHRLIDMSGLTRFCRAS
jgi:glycosyltransferase involved in cell wall biosynthesis